MSLCWTLMMSAGSENRLQRSKQRPEHMSKESQQRSNPLSSSTVAASNSRNSSLR